LSRIVPAEEFDLIEQVISEYPEGIGISALEKALALHLPKSLNRRTLQRRLKRLLADKRIATEGESIALFYKRASSMEITAGPLVAESSIGGEAEVYVPVSPEGGIIRDLVRQPLMRRKPVGYQRSFHLSELARHPVGKSVARRRRLWKVAPSSSRYFRVGIPPTGHAPGFGRLFSSTAAKSSRNPRSLRTGVFRDGAVALSATL
jgi:hypothetical protein